jgi:hypothetical protein
VAAWGIKAMNTTLELIYLHEVMERLCKLYLAMEKAPDEHDRIQKLKIEIMETYSEIVSMRTEGTRRGHRGHTYSS